MKFRMAPNSLFAVLLRSPWWISLCIAAVFVAIAQALLPPEYRTVGSMGAFPFAAIGVVAFWRQMRAPSAGRVQAALGAAATMSWPEFEAALRAGYARAGWQVAPGGGAADLRLERDGVATLVSARRWKAARHGEETVAALAAAMRRETVGAGVYVALGELSPQARKRAGAEGIAVLQGEALARLLLP
jgi:restriction system protein